MRRKLDQWRSLATGERWLLVRLAVLLPVIGGAIRLLGLRRTYGLLARRVVRAAPASTRMATAVESAARLARLVDIAARHGPYGATCLRRSLALWWLLRRRGLPAELRVGVTKTQGRVHAHAWVELGGCVVNDRPAVADEYAVYERLDVHLPGRAGGLAR